MKTLRMLFLALLAAMQVSAQDVNWIASGSSTQFDETYDVVSDASGNVYAVGRFGGTASWGGPVTNTAGVADVFLAKYNSSGTIQWVKNAGSSNSDWGYAVALNGNG